MTTLTERYNRKRTPVVQRPELSTTPLVEPEVAGSQNPIAPTVDNTDETVPQTNVGEPRLNDYQWSRRFFDEYMTPPITKEEEERRKRAASAVTGIGHLGNVLSSFANLAFAGETPSQKLPTVADSKLQSISDRLMAERQKYASGRLAAINTDFNNYQRALQLYRQDQARKEDLAAREAALERQNAIDRWNMDKWKKEYEADQAYKKRRLDLDAEKMALEKREVENREKSGYYSGRSSRRTSVSSNNNGTIILDTPDGFMDIDMSRVNLSTLSQMFNSLPDSVKKNYRISSKDSEKDRQAKYMSAIGEAAKADPSIADYLYRSGLGTLREGDKDMSKSIDIKDDVIPWDPSMITNGHTDQPTTENDNEIIQYRPVVDDQESDTSDMRNENVYDNTPTDPYDIILQDRDRRISKKTQEQEEARRKAEEYRLNDEQSYYDRISELESKMVRERDVEKFIKDNNLGLQDAARARLLFNDIRKDNAKIKREIDYLYKQLNKKYPQRND